MLNIKGATITIASCVFLFLLPARISCRTRRLAGAEQANVGDFPYLVALLHPEVRCTGSIISPQWVLSAAHCSVVEGRIVRPSEMAIIAGVVDFNDTMRPSRQIRYASAIHPHPKYEELRIAGSDIALIKADKPFDTEGHYVSVIHVSGSPFLVNSDVECTASGWGDTKDSTSNSKLHKLRVIAAQSKSVCHGLSTRERKNMICLRNKGGAGLCDGDSGGPLVCNNEIVGVAHQVYIEKVNYTGPNDMDCGSRTLVHTYMFVCPYLEWIRSYIPEVPVKPKKCFTLNLSNKEEEPNYD